MSYPSHNLYTMRSTKFVLSLGSAVAAQWRLKEDGSISISINCALKVTERLPSWTRTERNTNDSREITFELQVSNAPSSPSQEVSNAPSPSSQEVSNAPSPSSQAVCPDGTITCKDKDKEELQKKELKLQEKIASHWETTTSIIAEKVESWAVRRTPMYYGKK
jgi:cytoskeletal protein RodZ